MPNECYKHVIKKIAKLKNSYIKQLESIDKNIERDVKLFEDELKSSGFTGEALAEATSVYREQLRKWEIRQIENKLKEINALEIDLKEEAFQNLEKFTKKGLAYYLS